MKVTLDTNVLLSATFWKGESYKILISGEQRKIQIYASQNIIDEVKEVIQLDKFQNLLLNQERSHKEYIASLLGVLTLIEINSKVDIIKEHEEDNRIVECDLDSNSEYLISYNKHILKHATEINFIYQIKVVTPTEFLKLVL